jgi:Carboxylesterase family
MEIAGMRWINAAIIGVIPGLAAFYAHDVLLDPIAKVSGGEIRGCLPLGGGAPFKGMPFAQPPVGRLCWRDPAPVNLPRQGIRMAGACLNGRKFSSGKGPCLEFTVHGKPVTHENLRRDICDKYIDALKETIPINTAGNWPQ